MNTRVIATAGHVDHGKSTLIHALTGTDPDRFPEEKARGLTIDLGFAFAQLGDYTVGFVDVPGHVRFVKNMLAGVGAVEVALLVVAANEGVMPQTAEHIQILQLFGIAHGVIALTKAALVDDETLELAELELLDALEETTLAQWPIIAVDTPSGLGLDRIRSELELALERAPAPVDLHRPRMWIDRAFAAKGAGTVVTGTLTLGSLHVDEEVMIEPAGRSARIRSIQSGHTRVASATPGTRVALNLAGVDHHEVQRGDAVVGLDIWHTTNVVDVEFQTSGSHELPARGTVSVHVGSGERTARWRRLDATGTYGRLRFDRPLALQPSDRLVLRSTARRAVMGGAVVTDVAPPHHWRSPDSSLTTAAEGVITTTPWLNLQQIIGRAGLDPTTAQHQLHQSQLTGAIHNIDDTYIAGSALQHLTTSIHDAVTAYHETHPDEPGANLAELSNAVGIDARKLRSVAAMLTDLVIDHETIRSQDHLGKASETPEGRSFLQQVEAAPFSPPSPTDVGVDLKIVKLLVREGLVEQHSDLYFATSALDRAKHVVAEAIIAKETLTIADIRDLLGTSRKYALPIVAVLDSAGITRRRGDDRIAGPRAEQAALG